MSELGDVIWADDRAWMLIDTIIGEPKWTNPIPDDEDSLLTTSTTNELGSFSDFRWIVRDGELLLVDIPIGDENDKSIPAWEYETDNWYAE